MIQMKCTQIRLLYKQQNEKEHKEATWGNLHEVAFVRLDNAAALTEAISVAASQ